MEVDCGDPSSATGTGHQEFAEEEARTSDECVEPSPVEKEDTPGNVEVETKKMDTAIDDSKVEDPKKGTYKELSHMSPHI